MGPAAFQQVTRPLGIGTAPVNPVRGPGLNNFDVSVFKNVAPREGMRLQIGAEFFNLFNHSQFEALGGGIGSATFGQVTDARDPRVIQLRAKLSF